MKRLLFILMTIGTAISLHAAEPIITPDCTYMFEQRDTCDLFLDIYNPASGSETTFKGHEKPTILFIFGGGFIRGTRDDEGYLPWFKMLTDNGYRVVSIDYRLGLKGADKVGIAQVNLLDKAQKVTVQSNTLNSIPIWHKFREKQQIKGNTNTLSFNLKPYPCMVLSSKVFDSKLPTRQEVISKIAKLEKIRLSRPNILLGKGLDIEISTSNTPRSTLGMQNKLFDGTLDMLAWQHVNKKTSGFIDMLFPKFVPQFSKVRIWGNPANKNIKISIRKAGRWQNPKPKKVTQGKWFVEFDYGTMLRTIRMKIEFPKQKVVQEDIGNG